MSNNQKPYAIMAIKNNEFGGVCNTNAASLGAFLVDMVREGYSIKPVFSRTEYEEELARLT